MARNWILGNSPRVRTSPQESPARAGLFAFLGHPNVIRDTDTIPYRKTQAYARAVALAAIQRAAMHHRVCTLWPSQRGQSTSGMLRTAGRK